MPTATTTRRQTARDSKGQIFAAAAAEFAERGYDAAGVDRIAARAGVNKAMLYYHFGSKADLYREVLQEMFRPLSVRVRAIASGAGTAPEKIDTWVATLVEEAAARPHFPPIMLRELASGAAHLDADTLALLGALYGAVRDIVREGQAAGVFRSLSPLLVTLTVIPTVMFYLARNRAIARRRLRGTMAETVAREDFVRHIQEVARRMLRQE